MLRYTCYEQVCTLDVNEDRLLLIQNVMSKGSFTPDPAAHRIVPYRD